jgi:N-acetylglucosaminyldiphosphoundecaprenol N-acetyl-beta-D-mannosaminyltransferase
MGAPRQEVWIDEHKEELAKHGKVIAFGVGGLLDFWGGREKRAPKIVRQFSLEWLWRLVTKPRKNAKKVFTSLLFFRELFK